MDARPILYVIAKTLREQNLEAILIGNAAAALHGVPVTTVDFDFFFRKTPGNVAKLKAVAKSLDAVVMRPYYPVSDLFRIERDADFLQMDFMGTIDGIRSFEGMKSRSVSVDFGGEKLLLASLHDIIKSKRAAGRPRDKAVLDTLEKALNEAKDHKKGEARRSPKGK